MTYRIHWMPYAPEDGSRPLWEVSVSPDVRVEGDGGLFGECNTFESAEQARAFVTHCVTDFPMCNAVITIRATHV